MLSLLSLKGKLLAMSFTLAVVVVAIGFTGIFALRGVDEKYAHVAAINLPNQERLGEMMFAASETGRYIARIMNPKAPAAYVSQTLGELADVIKRYETADKAYGEVPFVEGEQQLYDAVSSTWKTYAAHLDAARQLWNAGDAASKDKFHDLLLGDLANARTANKDAMRALLDFQGNEAKKWSSEAAELGRSSIVLAIALASAGTLFSLILGFFFARSLARNLSDMAKGIADSSLQVSSASEQLASASQQLSAGSTQSASSLEETVASVEELTSMVKLNADNSKEAATLSQTSRQSAEDGESEMRKLTDAMGEISESSKKIEEIINVIDDIAFQTNLLALNAAVEAARAGEQGKGFAVVAEAVRNLAQRSASAAKDITTLIKDSVLRIDRGTKVADEGAKALKNIVSTVKKVADLNNEIASASQEQSNGLAQISKAMNELDQATQRNASSAEETAAASEEMSGQAVVLQDTVRSLTALINGGRDTGASDPSPNASRKAAPAVFSPAGRAKGTHRLRVAASNARTTSKADNVIPFDEDQVALKVGTTDGF
jgi:methyl-accepting chemotaxis protein